MAKRRTLSFSFTTLLAVGFALLLGGSAQAVSLGGFTCITNNSAGDCAIGSSQLSADLTGSVLTVTMTGTQAAVVEQIFIQGAGVTSGTFLSGGPAGSFVVFGNSSAGGNLPGGNQPSVNFIEKINFAAASPAPKKGIGYHSQDPVSGQYATFNLVGDLSNLRIGVHVIGYASGGSESFVTGRVERPIPEPSAALVFALGATLVGGATRRDRR